MSVNRNINRVLFRLPVVLVLFASCVFAQEMTERHIPVGAYPYLKSEYLAVGTIVDVDNDARTLTLEMNGSERSFRLTNTTRIWLDRSHFGQSTEDGELSDLATGLKAEVRSLGPSRSDVAYWVKVQVAPP